jgi:hypothetical protein
VMWINPSGAGTVVPKDDGQWHNIGGDKLWPAPQAAFGWPPPYQFDCGPSTVEPIPGGIRLKSQVNPKFGAYGVREFVLDASRPLVRARQKLVKAEGNAAGLILWTVSQVREPDFAILPAAPAAGAERFKALQGKPTEPQLGLHKSVVSIRYDETLGAKIGVAPDANLREGWVAGVFGRTMIVQSQALAKSASYPDGGLQAEIFTATKEHGRYMELELLSPLKELKPGEEMSNDEVWQLVNLEDAQADDPERAGAVARELHASALKVLNEK